MILILAAGASSRMRGGDKLLEQVDAEPLVRRQAHVALATNSPVLVTLPSLTHPRAKALSGLAVQQVEVPDADLGMSASLYRGVAALPKGAEAVMILPGDMPELQTEDLQKLIAAFDSAPSPCLVQAAAQDGTPGHPVLFPKDCFDDLAHLDGDQGARSVLRANAHRLLRIALPGQRALIDLDTPEDWAHWRRTNTDRT